MGDELLLGPVDLVGHLGQVGAAAVALTDVDAVTVELELVEALDASHGREDGDLDVEVVELITGDGRETGVLEGSSARHLSHDLVEGNVFAEVADAAAQTSLFVEGDEGAAGTF